MAESPKAPQDTYCVLTGKQYGPQSASLKDKLTYCFQWAAHKVKDTPKLLASNKDNTVKVFGYNNLIFIRRGQNQSVISGEMSKLNDVQAVSLSADGETIAVLDKFTDKSNLIKQQLLFFKVSQNGNVVPFSVNTEENLIHAQHITFGAQANEVLVLIRKSMTSSEIVSFQFNQDSRSPIAANRPQKKNILSTADPAVKDLKDISDLKYDEKKKTLFIYDSNGNFAQHSY